jgi:hypothetical protein
MMVKCSVLFEVWTEFLNIFWVSFSFKGLNDFHDVNGMIILETLAASSLNLFGV